MSGWLHCGCSSCWLGADVVNASDMVSLLGVMVASDLSLDGRVSSGFKMCFFGSAS